MSSPDEPKTEKVSAVLARIASGMRGTSELLVGPEHTAPFVGSGRIAVLATPVMINVIEAAALALRRACRGCRRLPDRLAAQCA